jgi:hypothetical protein
MAATHNTKAAGSKKPAEHANELRDLVVRYAKQETIDPIVGLKRTVTFGLAGAICIGLGVAFATLGLLRGLQQLSVFQQDGPTPGALTLVPYAAAFVFALVVIGLAGVGIKKSTQPKRRSA